MRELMSYLTVSVTVIAFITGLAGGWKLQAYNIQELKNEHQQEQLLREREARAALSQYSAQVRAAENLAAQRAVALRVAATGATVAVKRVRESSAAALSAAAASHEACLIGAAAFRSVFDKCSEEYRELGERAGRHVNDIQLLRDQPD